MLSLIMRLIFLCILLIVLVIRNLISSPLVSTDWLSINLCKDSIKVIEVGKSLHSYEVEHISCATYTNFYTDKWRVKKNYTPFLLPETYQLKTLIESFGIRETDSLVLYPKKNYKYAMAEVTSIYFTFKYLGHKNIYILNGGFYDFKKKYPLKVDEGLIPIAKKSNYKFNIDKSILANYEDVKENIKLNRVVVDSRENDFFYGINKLDGFPSYGTIKGSNNIPSMWNLQGRKLQFNENSVLKKIYKIKNINGAKDYPIFFCYAGLESSLNWFVSSEILKHKKSRLYEPSLYDWVNRKQELFIN